MSEVLSEVLGEVLANYQALMQHEATPLLLGLVFAFAFQLVVFRWAERSNLVTATYFVTTVAFVGGPFARAVVEMPGRVFNISDREVVWTLLSFSMTIVGIACSSSPRQRSSAMTTIARPSGSAPSSSAHALPT